MLLLSLSCVKYPDFAAHRREAPTEPVPGYVELGVLQPDSSPTAVPQPMTVEVPALAEPAPALPAALDLSGSRWTLSYSAPSGEHSYDLEFLAEGRLRLHNPHDNTPDNDSWVQGGAVVELAFNDGFVTYRGVYQDRELIRGMADNGQDSWPFVLVRHSRAMQRASSLEPDPGRDELVGRSFALTDLDPIEPTDLQITLQEEGVLVEPLGVEANDWTLSGGVLYVWINEHAAELMAVETEPGQWFGVGLSREGHEWAFTMEESP